MSKDTGGSAFPNDGGWANGHQEGGMTLRDYFAAKCMVKMLDASSPWDTEKPETLVEIAKASYAMADVMIAERAKE